ncbi:hypothetical protein PIROE2DRAFT_9178 [Piromyces sp. E2]|nr:hypothetical protein PIROE2DRAFT_9178 [Piromyces sp. E2]|eukprot:OUM64139.1 hypothetical protein PIROE2DRAFT_9178 [Piromyces sp. E2]
MNSNNNHILDINDSVSEDINISNDDIELVTRNNNDNEYQSLLGAPKQEKKTRLYWADCARIYSMFAIVFLHCSNYGFEIHLIKTKDPNWKIVCIYNSLTRFSVPLFVLLSGTFFLDPSKSFSFKKLIKRNILRLVTAFYFWAFVNSLYKNIARSNGPSFFSAEFQKNFIGNFLVGEEYLWFILMIIGCYIISPFLRFFSDNIPLARYFICLWLLWSSFIPTLDALLSLFNINHSGLDVWISRWNFHFTKGFVGYFVTGYHIVKHVNIENFRNRCILYIICVIDIIIYIKLTLYHGKKANGYSDSFRGNFSIFVAYYAFVTFLFFKYEVGRIKFSYKMAKIINKLSSLTFGMYLTHLLIRNILLKFLNIDQRNFIGITYSPVIGCPILFMIVSSLSILISYGISRIPILKNYII